MIRIVYRGEEASITVGRDSPSYVYGGRDLPDDIQGFPAFILDTKGLGVDGSGSVYRDGSINYTFGGGTDGRDLTQRPVSPIGELAYTPATIKVSDEEIENPDGSKTKTRSTEFDLPGTMRRMTGETALEIELGTESLGNLVPGTDFTIGDRVLLSIWGRDIEVIVSGYSYTPTGWMATVQTEDQLRDFEAQKRRLSSTTFWEEIEEVREELRGIQDDSAYAGEGGVEGDSGGGGISPGSITILPGNVFSYPGGAYPQQGHTARVTATMRGVDRLHEEITDHLKDLSPQHSESKWSGSGTGDYILEDIGPLENVSSSGLGAFSWILPEDTQAGSGYEWGSRPLQDKGLLCGMIYLSINYVGKNEERGTHNAVARVINPGNRSVGVLFQDRVDSDWNVRVTSTDRNLNIQSNIDSGTVASTDVNAIFIPDYGEMSKAFDSRTGIGLIDKKITPSYREGSPGLAIENVQITGTISGTVL